MTLQQRGHLCLSTVGRAVPRMGGAALGLALWSSDTGAFTGVGGAIFVLSAMTNPVRWWHYVLTGARPRSTPASEFSKTGVWRVDLQDSGARPVEVIKAIRETTSVALPEITSMVESTPSTIVQTLSEASAGRVRDRLERAGATASIATGDDS